MTYQQAHLKRLMYQLAKKRKTRPSSKKSKPCKSAFTPAPLYVCLICQISTSYIVETVKQYSICPEKCNIWFHFECVRIKAVNDVPAESDALNCIRCSVIFKIV